MAPAVSPHKKENISEGRGGGELVQERNLVVGKTLH